jgi:putative ABC transport system ATP-binding protein
MTALDLYWGESIMAAVVQTVNLKKTYMLGKVPVNALRGVNLEVESGDFLAIVGPSGSGKSTLLNMIGALDKPTEGKVLIDGVDVSALNDDRIAEMRRHIGFVFQFFNLIPRLTASENVELPLAIAGVDKRDRIEKTKELLKSVGLDERAEHNPTELSGGEQQRVAIARALANSPRFLLLDEPTGNIDSKTADMLIVLLKSLNEEKGVTIIMITHDLNIAKNAKHIVHLLDGKIEETGNI